MAAKPEKYDIRLTVARENKYDLGERSEQFTAHAVYMVEPESTSWNPNDAGVRNPSLTAWEQELRPLGDLAITAYRKLGHSDDCLHNWYGYELEYHSPFRVNLQQLEFMVKFMRKVNAKLAKFDEQWGRSEDLAGYCARAVQAIGGHPSFGIYHKEVQISGTHYRWVDVDGLRSWLEKPADA
jgi:hypothetical protein